MSTHAWSPTWVKSDCIGTAPAPCWGCADAITHIFVFVVVLPYIGLVFTLLFHLKRDEYREDAHYQLIWYYWKLGRRNDALRQYKQCATVLASDLGFEPTAELQKLNDMIIRGETQSDVQELLNEH